MMRHTLWVSGVALAIAIMALSAGAEDIHVGWIDKIACQAEWRENDRARPKKLYKDRDRYRFLYAGESVRCSGPGSITLQDHACSSVKVTAWYTLRREGFRCSDGTSAEEAANFDEENEVANFGRPAGRQRDLGSLIFSPANDAVVRVAGLFVGWTANVGSGPILLRVLDDNDAELWRKDEVDGTAGRLDSEDLRQVLANQRDRNYVGKLTLSLASTGSDEAQVKFSLLSRAKEQALDADLLRCASKQSLMRNACRAYAFETRSLWNDLVAEYDYALTLASANTDLLIAAISYHRKIGDTDAVDRLTVQLPPGTKMPE
jgi:hypothetical protein